MIDRHFKYRVILLFFVLGFVLSATGEWTLIVLGAVSIALICLKLKENGEPNSGVASSFPSRSLKL